MDNTKYESLLERSVLVQEGTAEAVKSLSENMKKFNDNFALHCASQGEIKGAVFLIKKELLKLITYLVIAVIAVAGGKEIINLILK